MAADKFRHRSPQPPVCSGGKCQNYRVKATGVEIFHAAPNGSGSAADLALPLTAGQLVERGIDEAPARCLQKACATSIYCEMATLAGISFAKHQLIGPCPENCPRRSVRPSKGQPSASSHRGAIDRSLLAHHAADDVAQGRSRPRLHSPSSNASPRRTRPKSASTSARSVCAMSI